MLTICSFPVVSPVKDGTVCPRPLPSAVVDVKSQINKMAHVNFCSLLITHHTRTTRLKCAYSHEYPAKRTCALQDEKNYPN